jgi:hypothetical protein
MGQDKRMGWSQGSQSRNNGRGQALQFREKETDVLDRIGFKDWQERISKKNEFKSASKKR